MTERIARFSCTFDGDPDGNVELVLNAGSDRGFTLVAIHVNWLSEDMTGSSDVPQFGIARFTGSAADGTAGVIFSHTDGDTPETSALINPATLGTNQVDGPQFWPGVASFTGSAWYTHGGQYLTDFDGGPVFAPIFVAEGNSLLIRTTNCITTTAHFYENLTP